MAYQKQTWRDFDDTKTDLQNINNGAVVTTERLNHIENGIANSADKAEVTAQLQQTASKLLDYTGVTPQDYGAVGDGVFRTIADALPEVTLAQVKALNDSATLNNSVDWYGFQRAINDNDFIFSKGSYIIDIPLKINHNNVAISGKDTYISNISTTPVFIVGEYTQVLYRFKLSGLIIKGEGHGVDLRGVQWLEFDNVNISGNKKTGLYADKNSSVWNAIFNNSKFLNNKENGIYMEHSWTGQKNAISFRGCYISRNGDKTNGATNNIGHGAVVSGTNIVFNTGCTFEDNSGYGVYSGGFNNHETEIIRGLEVSGCYFEPNLNGDIMIDNELVIATGLNITGNYTTTTKTNSTNGHLKVVNPGQIDYVMSVVKGLPIVSDFYQKRDIKRVTFYTLDNFEEYIAFDGVGQYEIIIDYNWTKISANSKFLIHLFMYDVNFNQINFPTPNFIPIQYITETGAKKYVRQTYPLIPTNIITIFGNIKYLKPRLSITDNTSGDTIVVDTITIKKLATPI